ncbi:helix-turn-helix domain-containing protein, partial [Salmonella enterica subsp. enterica]|uniref:helix-turn-helix domain-containing protein n=2 Tax=Pseudomonadota TaxID=1224 RepID=UPI0022B6FB08
KDTNVVGHNDLTLYSEEEWAQAQRRFLVIKPLLENPIRSRTDAEKIADSSGVHVATLYRWLKNYQEAGHVSALVPSKRGRKYGSK